MIKIFLAFIMSISAFTYTMDLSNPAQSLMEVDLKLFPIIQKLPPEILQPILYDAIVQAPTLDKAVKNFAQSTAVNWQTMAFRHDKSFNGIIIQALQGRFSQEEEEEELEDIVVKMNTKEALDWYLQAHPNALQTNDSIDRFLRKAVTLNRPQSIKAVIEHKNISLTGDKGTSFLNAAIWKGAAQAVAQLLELGADSNNVCPTTGLEVIPLHSVLLASISNSKKIMMARSLLAKKAKVNAQDSAGNTALHLAASGPLVNELLINGAHCNAQKGGGYTPLMEAISESFNRSYCMGLNPMDQINRLLEDPSINLECKDHYGAKGETAIMIALYANPAIAEQVIKALIDKGAKVNAQDKAGRTVLDIANIWKNRVSNHTLEMLRNAGALTSDELAAQQPGAAAACPR